MSVLSKLDNISSNGINTVGGEIIEFFGKNFGDEATQVAAYTVESNVQNFSNCIINTPHDSIICTTPEGQGANVGVVVVVKSNYSDQSSANHSFLIDYKKPKIVRIRNNNLRHYDARKDVIVEGENFGSELTSTRNLTFALMPDEPGNFNDV